MAEIASTYADAIVSICETPTRNRALSAGQYEAFVFEPIANVVTVPAFSVEEDIQTRDYVAQLGVHMKGAKRGVQTEIVVGKDTSDDGYKALVDASLTSAWYPMKIEYADSPNPTTTTNTVEYALVLVMRGTKPGGGANDDTIQTFPLAVQSEVISVAPEAVGP